MEPAVSEWLEDILTHVDLRWGPEGIEVLIDWVRVAHMPEEVRSILKEASGEDIDVLMGVEDD